MSGFFDNLKYFFLSKEEKRKQIALKNRYANGSSKHVFGSGAELTINTETQKIVDDVKQNVSDIVKQTNCEAKALIDYVKMSKTPVFRIKNVSKYLNLIKESDGLIFEKHGLEALYLSVITGQGFKIKTEPMFVLGYDDYDNYAMLYHFYNWYSMKAGLGGFEYETRENFKRMILSDTDRFIKNLNVKQIMGLKEAIARDKEATEFVLEYTKRKDGSKNVMDKIQNNGGADI